MQTFSFQLENDRVERSKRRCFLTLTFLVKSVSKNWLIRTSEVEELDDSVICIGE